MTRLLYIGTFQYLMLICLFQWRPLAVLGDSQKLHHGQGLMSNRTSPGLGSPPAGSVPPYYYRTYRRGTTSVNITRQANYNSSLPSESICPYKLFSEGPANYKSLLCFRTIDSSFHCDQRDCKVFRSGRSLLANVLRNSSVLLQWQPPAHYVPDLKGFFINCSWNGTFTRFQCDSIQLGVSCRDYLLTNVHDNVRYRICMQTLYTNRTSVEECVDFVVEPVGMQDIVKAMTAVGGSICVMLVIICLLVAYITENLMHPTFMHPATKRGP